MLFSLQTGNDLIVLSGFLYAVCLDYSQNTITGSLISLANSDISDCKKVVGNNGEIGYCYNCSYYRKNHMSYFLDNDDIYKSKIDKELHFLSTALKSTGKHGI
ncbi:hypothetical protein LBYZC6_18310 [Lacrimispora brassicae]